MSDETSEEMFERVLQPRLDGATKALELIGNLSAKRYGWTQDRVQEVFKGLVGTLGASLGRFKADPRWVAASPAPAAPEPADEPEEHVHPSVHDGSLVVQLQRMVREHGARRVVGAMQWVISNEQARGRNEE